MLRAGAGARAGAEIIFLMCAGGTAGAVTKYGGSTTLLFRPEPISNVK